MSDGKFNQLCFDISEKVRLHPQQPGIGTLLGLDLSPDVQIKDEGKHLKIQGYLRLKGTYLADQEEGALDTSSQINETNAQEDLAYVIPVEITIPADRAELDKISAEIETFDYSVISPFELQVEAILAIDGLLPENQEKEVENYEVIPKIPTFTAKPMTVAMRLEQEDMLSSPFNESEKEQKEFEQDKDVNNQQEILEDAPEENPSNYNEPVLEKGVKNIPEVQFASHSNENQEEDRVPESSGQDEDSVSKSSGQDEDRVKRSSGKDSPLFSVDSLDNLWTKRKQKDEDLEENSVAAREFMYADEEKSHDNSLKNRSFVERTEKGEAEWIDWLVGNKKETFVSMRMVIVQKNQSIDHLAERYSTSVGHIMRLNKLSDDYLEEGQIIYVPETLQKTS